MTEHRVYMDHNATTPLHPEVKKTLVHAMEVFGNPSSMHSFGREARALVEGSRETIASFINAKPEELIFTGSGSEANNTVLNVISCTSTGCECPVNTRKQIVTTKIEHPCVLETAACLAQRGEKVKYIGVDKEGKIDLNELDKSVSDKTAVVSVMAANNEIGTIQDLKKISEIVHKKGALFHTDAVQALGKYPIDVNGLGIDYLSFSGHKIYGPKGTGVLYVRKGIPFCPFIRGGHQERGLRAGTENTLGIIGLGKAVEMRKIEMQAEHDRLLGLKNHMKTEIAKRIPDIAFNGHQVDCLPGTLNVSFAGAEGEAILLYLDLAGIAVSTGSACASGSLDPSHVLLALGLQAEQAHGSIRISLGRDNTKEDADYVVNNLVEIIAKVRKMSSAYMAH
jgi:cysteine desulfurase